MKRENLERANEIENDLHFYEADLEEITNRDRDQLCSFKCQSKDNLTCEIDLNPSEERKIVAMLVNNRKIFINKLLKEMEEL